MSYAEKRRQIREAVIQAIAEGKAELETVKANLRKVTIGALFEEEEEIKGIGWAVTDIFDVKQGVTWGGEGCESIYVINETTASTLEPDMVKKTIGGRDLNPWNIKWEKTYVVFPYIASGNRWIRGFQHPSLGDTDALDFSIMISSYERGKSVSEILSYRVAQGVISYPRTASYLIDYYKKLSQRIFEGKNLSDYNKSWYEYHRPREPSIATKPKIVCKRMMKEPTFALDEEGYLPRDSVMSLIPKERFKEVKEELKKVIGDSVNIKDVFNYVLSFLNSDLFAKLLAERRAKKRGGYPIVDERMMRRFLIPIPSLKHAKKIKKILKGDLANIALDEFYTVSEKTQREITQF